MISYFKSSVAAEQTTRDSVGFPNHVISVGLSEEGCPMLQDASQGGTLPATKLVPALPVVRCADFPTVGKPGASAPRDKNLALSKSQSWQ